MLAYVIFTSFFTFPELGFPVRIYLRCLLQFICCYFVFHLLVVSFCLLIRFQEWTYGSNKTGKKHELRKGMFRYAVLVKLPDIIERVQNRAQRYQEAPISTRCEKNHGMELRSKLFTNIKEPESRLRHLVPSTRSQAHGRSLRNKDRPSSHKLQN